MRYLETGSLDPAYNLAFEETALNCCREGDWLILWQNENTVVVGQNQNPAEEIDPAYAESHGVRVIRRITGGGAVYHDLGNLNYSFLTDAEEAETLSTAAFAEFVAEALRALGVPAVVSGRNDILVEGKKVSGTAQYLRKGRLLHHGTLLFDSDPARIAGALRADPEKFRSKSTKSVRSRVGNLRDWLPADMDMTDFRDFLRRHFAGETPAETLPEEMLAEVRRLKAEKYDTWEWTFGRSPQYDVTHRRRWEGGTLSVSLSADRGTLTDIAFRGDFLSRKDPSEVEDALRGLLFRPKELSAALVGFHLPDYFGTVTAEEILRTVFDT